MSRATRKTVLTTVDGTPKKRLFLSIISDYDLKTGLCELIDNALDQWLAREKVQTLHIAVTLDHERQLIQVRDDAGGIPEDQAELLISPGASRNQPEGVQIGIFGVGGKRAGVALGELVEIRTRHENDNTIQIDLNKEWIESTSWDLDIYEIPNIDPRTTIVDITKLRQGFSTDDIDEVYQHLGETYGRFISMGCEITLNRKKVLPLVFDAWAFPPDFSPREMKFQVEPVSDRYLDVTVTGGLIVDRIPEGENYGVYFYCNDRLIVKELKSRDVGYFVTNEAGVPHPDASLARVIIEFEGSADLMPWNSSKSGINFSHPAFTTIRKRVIEFTGYYSKVSRRLQGTWDRTVFSHTVGVVEELDSSIALSSKKKLLPNPPSTKQPNRMEVLKKANQTALRDKPWTLGLIEAMGMVDLLSRQKFETRNRAALILLDSNFEISLKEFIVHRKDLFPAHKYTNTSLVQLFGNRTNVLKEVLSHVKISAVMIGKINHYYDLRNNLVHQRATVPISDKDVADYNAVIEKVLKKLFDLKFPA